MTDNVVNLPDLSITLDLDAYERPESDVKPPFVVKIGGRKITMIDPADVDWRDLLRIDAPTDFLTFALSQDDLNFLKGQNIPGWRFNKLLEAYYVHYDLEGKIAEAKRRGALG